MNFTEYRFTETEIPANETNYFCQYFPIDIQENTTQHVVGYEMIIDNAEVMHHTIVYGCKQDEGEMVVLLLGLWGIDFLTIENVSLCLSHCLFLFLYHSTKYFSYLTCPFRPTKSASCLIVLPVMFKLAKEILCSKDFLIFLELIKLRYDQKTHGTL